MISIFDLEKLDDVLKDFYNISQIRITVFDENLTELISYPREVAPYCNVIRQSLEGLEACMDCDRCACKMAANIHRTHIYRCHAGLTEAVTPLYIGDVLIGYLLFGHVFSYPSHEEGWAVIQRLCASLPVDKDVLHDTVFEAIPIEESYIRSAARILHAVASYLSLEHMATLNENLLAVRLDSYLSAHFTEKLNAVQLSKHLNIGKTQLYELSHRLYGCGTAERIRTLRMNKAKELMLYNPDLPLSEVAFCCGYSDYNYFITVFTRENGLPPGAWRNAKTANDRNGD